MYKTLLFLALFVVLCSPVLAIGVSPPSATIQFSPSSSGDFDILVQNTQTRTIGTTVEVRGDLGQYFSATMPSIGPRGSATATISWELPEDISPGKHRVDILFREDFFDETTGSVSVRTAVAFTAFVWKPYPGKYADITVEPTNVPAGQNTQAKVTLYSRGDQPMIGDLKIQIFDADNRLLDTQVKESLEIDANTQLDRFFQLLTASYEPGKYIVRAEYDYNEAVASGEAQLTLGEKTVLINNLSRAYYRDVSVNRFEVELESMWNEPLEGVSASVQLGSRVGQTPSITLAPFTKKTLTGYWDTDPQLLDGEHSALVTASFIGGEPVERTFSVVLYNESPSVPQKESPDSIVYISFTDVIFIIIIFLTITYFFMHTRKRHSLLK